jgi:hypothetical protein
MILHNMAIMCLFSAYASCLKISHTSFNRRSNVYFKTMAHCACCLWNTLDQFRGSECAAGGFWLGVCWHHVFVSVGN